MYSLKLGEVVTTIPTIGFNVESIVYKDHEYSLWDVGGCDKIRPLFRHYMDNLSLVMLVIDSNDSDRLGYTDEFMGENVIDEFLRMMSESESDGAKCPILVLANKQDLPRALPVEEIQRRLLTSKYLQDDRLIEFLGVCATSPSDVELILPTMYRMIQMNERGIKRIRVPSIAGEKKSMGPSDNLSSPVSTQTTDKESLDKKFEEWLIRHDEEDEEFLSKLDSFKLDSWDHRTHLRIAFIHLMRFGRREGMKLIFRKIKAYIANSSHDVSRTTFHESMTYFWVHMVDYAINVIKVRQPTLFLPVDPSSPLGLDFKSFLVLSPHLCDGGLFLQYYSKPLILNYPAARLSVVLPDKRPLPSIISESSDDKAIKSTDRNDSTSSSTNISTVSRVLSDEEFMIKLHTNDLPSWGHESMLRVVYIDIVSNGRSRDSLRNIMNLLHPIETIHQNMTVTYFWVHMMTIAVARSKDRDTPFVKFIALPQHEKIRNQLYIYE